MREYQFWFKADLQMLARINDLIEDARRHPFVGIGKPEPLKGDLSGSWSRRITSEHRLLYRVLGREGLDQRIEIASCQHHYLKV